MSNYYILGLDLGIASIGWCLYEGSTEYIYDINGVISEDEEGNPAAYHKPVRIADLGSFIFNQIEDKDGKTENKKRGECRRMRRQRRRKVHRLERLRNFYKEQFNVDFLKDVIANREKYTTQNPFEIKIKGLENKLSKEELMIALYHYMKYRGFKSNRKAADKNDNENKKTLKRIKDVEKEIGDRNVTITQYFIDEWKKRCANNDVNNRIHNWTSNDNVFNMDATRLLYLKEIKMLLDKQISFETIDESFKDKYLELYQQQRGFSDGPGYARKGVLSKYSVDFSKLRGTCIFDKLPRAVKDSITAKRFVLLSALNNFRYKDATDVRYHGLTAEQIRIAEKEIIYKEKFEYSKLLRLLKLKNVEVKGLTITRKKYRDLSTKFLKDKGIKEINDDLRPEFEKILQDAKMDQIFFRGSNVISEICKSKNSSIVEVRIDDEFFDDVAEVLFSKKDDDKIASALKDKGYSEKIIDAILDMNIDCKQVIDLSKEICEQVIVKMRNGISYDKALEELNYNHRGELAEWNGDSKIPPIDEALKLINITAISNPVVKNTLVNLRKVINALVDKYEHIDECVIELNRELKKSFQERKEIRNTQLENYENNFTDKLYLLNKYPQQFRSLADISKDDLIKFRLFKEQKHISPYSGKNIIESKLFSKNDYEIDHIIPYSRSFDDSYNNKVLVEKEKNQFKGNRMPYEVGGELFNSVNQFIKNTSFYPKPKKENLLRKEVSADFRLGNLTDTSYITKIAKDLISYFVLKDKKCRTTNGQITSSLRKSWNLSGKTHTYAVRGDGTPVSYNNYLYQARFDLDYKFKDIEITHDKDNASKELLKFIFETKKFVGNNQISSDFEVNIQKYYPKRSKNELTDEQKEFNNKFDDFYNNYNRIFSIHFNECVGKNVSDILNKISGEHMSMDYTTEQYAEHLDAVNVILTKVMSDIQSDIDKKNRDNHLHHALDAAIIGTVTYSIQHKFSNANKLGIIDNLQFDEPYADFRKEVLTRVYERDKDKLFKILCSLKPYQNIELKPRDVHVLIPVRQPKTRVEGAISNETIYGVSKTERNRATKKISVLKLKQKEIEKIVDKDNGNKSVYESVDKWFKAKQNRTQYPILEKKGTYIKYIKIYDNDVNKKVPLSLEGNRFADNSDVVRVEVYKKKDGNDNNLYMVPIYYYQIVNRRKGLEVSYNIMWAQGSSGSSQISSSELNKYYQRIAILPRYSLIEIELKDGSKNLVYSGGASSGMFEVYTLTGDYLDCSFNLKRNTSKNQLLITISSINSIKVRSISVLGKIS